MSIKRWAAKFGEDKEGRWVKHVDHVAEVARLNEQVRALAAENEMVRLANRRLIKEQQESWPIGLLEGFIVEHSPDIETTDAILNEVRAQAVEKYSITVGAEKDGAIYAARIRVVVEK